MANLQQIRVLALLCLLTLTTALSFKDGRPLVTINSGDVQGINKTENSTGQPLYAFLGVPFAGKPERWGAPSAPKKWKVPLDASHYGPACVQQFNYPEPRRDLIKKWFNTPSPAESEECLSACVYVPLDASKDSKKAVMVYFYGGGLLYGSNAMPLYDGSTLAAHEDVIVVAVNYRTNVFGFPGSDAIKPNNLGWLDQRYALDWVQKNIAAFGGEPANVTIFGESAGAESVDALITQPPNPLPFRAAIMQSGTATFRGRPADPNTSWDNLTVAMKCDKKKDVLKCMRGVSATKIRDYNELNRLSWLPVFDNVTSADTARSNRLSSTTANPIIARVPILGGTNADEGRLYSVTANDSATFIRGLLPGATDEQVTGLLAEYPLNGPPGSANLGGTFNSSFEQLGALYTDFVFQCPARLVQLESSQVGIPSYRYYYNASFPNTQWFDDAGVYHSSEIGIVFGTYPKTGATVMQDSLSRYLQHIWANFAKSPETFKNFAGGADNMAVLGGGVRAEQGNRASGIYQNVVNRTLIDQIDKRCKLYEPIYDAIAR